MTHAELLPRIPSANDAFKRNYPKVLRWSVLVALALTCLIAWLMPRYEPTPYTLQPDFVELVDLFEEPPVDTPLEELLPPPPIPRELEAVPDDTITDDDWIDRVMWDMPPSEPVYRYVEPTEAFVASSSIPRLMFRAKPAYPQIARMSGIEGTVIVKVLVGKDGNVLAAAVTQGVHPLLNQEALKAAGRCRFEPGTQRSIPVQAWMEMPYRFRLH